MNVCNHRMAVMYDVTMNWQLECGLTGVRVLNARFLPWVTAPTKVQSRVEMLGRFHLDSLLCERFGGPDSCRTGMVDLFR